VRNLPEEEVQYDVISGVSVGALNAAHVSTYAKGDEWRMSEDLITMWVHLNSSNFYRSWGWGGLVEGLLFK
jgi:NTE family protein